MDILNRLAYTLLALGCGSCLVIPVCFVVALIAPIVAAVVARRYVTPVQ